MLNLFFKGRSASVTQQNRKPVTASAQPVPVANTTQPQQPSQPASASAQPVPPPVERSGIIGYKQLRRHSAAPVLLSHHDGAAPTIPLAPAAALDPEIALPIDVVANAELAKVTNILREEIAGVGYDELLEGMSAEEEESTDEEISKIRPPRHVLSANDSSSSAISSESREHSRSTSSLHSNPHLIIHRERSNGMDNGNMHRLHVQYSYDSSRENSVMSSAESEMDHTPRIHTPIIHHDDTAVSSTANGDNNLSSGANAIQLQHISSHTSIAMSASPSSSPTPHVAKVSVNGAGPTVEKLQSQLSYMMDQINRLTSMIGFGTQAAPRADFNTQTTQDMSSMNGNSELPEYGVSSGEISPKHPLPPRHRNQQAHNRRQLPSSSSTSQLAQKGGQKLYGDFAGMSSSDKAAFKLNATEEEMVEKMAQIHVERMKGIDFKQDFVGVNRLLDPKKLNEARDHVLTREENERKEKMAAALVALPTVEDTEEELEKKRLARKPLRIANRVIGLFTLLTICLVVEEWVRSIVTKTMKDHQYIRYTIFLLIPISVFFLIFGVNVIWVSMNNLVGFVNHVQDNSPYYSIRAPMRKSIGKRERTKVSSIDPKTGAKTIKTDDKQDDSIDAVNGKLLLPLVTIQIPVFKESFKDVLKHTLESCEEACKIYTRQGGQVNIFVNDDGMLLLEPEQQVERMMYYYEKGIAWVARPPENRAGRFKKASNMNYCLNVARRVKEEIMKNRAHVITCNGITDFALYPGMTKLIDIHDTESCQFVQKILNDMAEKDGFLAGGNIQVGDYILLLDCDSRVPRDCMLDTVNELEQSPEVAFTEHLTTPMQVVGDYWENCIAHFTKRVYQNAITMSTSGGDMSPLMGHNAFLRWKALEEAARVDKKTGKRYYWSESHVSEDFDLAIRFYHAGFVGRYICYQTGWTEGVSLTIRDEITRFQKYAFGACEVTFNPFSQWLTKGPFGDVFKRLVTAPIGWTTKLNVMAYLGTYFAMAFSFPMALANFFLYQYSTIWRYDTQGGEMWESILLVFSVLAPLANVAQVYRTGKSGFFQALKREFTYTCQFMIFFNGLGIHLMFAILAHLFNVNMTWTATVKEVKLTNFFKELKTTISTYRWMYLICGSLTLIMVTFRFFVPQAWIVKELWAIFPLACCVIGSMLSPVILNPVLMRVTF